MQGRMSGSCNVDQDIQTFTVKLTGATDARDEEIQLDFCAEEDTDRWYGWVCVAAVFIINAHSWGINTVSINLRSGL